MKLLALETSGFVASAALLLDGKIIAEELLDGQLTHSQIAMPMLERVLLSAETEIEEIDVFAINSGPGSFTGLRIGICSVNAMAFALNKPVVAVDSLTCLAANAAYVNTPVCPLIDARNDQVYAGKFDLRTGYPEKKMDLFAGSISEFADLLEGEEDLLFLGDGALAQREYISKRFSERAKFMPANLNMHRAANLAVVAADKYGQGEFVKEAQPLYLRAPQAVRQRLEKEKLLADN